MMEDKMRPQAAAHPQLDPVPASLNDARRRMAYVRERLKELKAERERLMAERDSLQQKFNLAGAGAKAGNSTTRGEPA